MPQPTIGATVIHHDIGSLFLSLVVAFSSLFCWEAWMDQTMSFCPHHANSAESPFVMDIVPGGDI